MWGETYGFLHWICFGLIGSFFEGFATFCLNEAGKHGNSLWILGSTLPELVCSQFGLTILVVVTYPAFASAKSRSHCKHPGCVYTHVNDMYGLCSDGFVYILWLCFHFAAFMHYYSWCLIISIDAWPFIGSSSVSYFFRSRSLFLGYVASPSFSPFDACRHLYLLVSTWAWEGKKSRSALVCFVCYTLICAASSSTCRGRQYPCQ